MELAICFSRPRFYIMASGYREKHRKFLGRICKTKSVSILEKYYN